jgi:5-methylcytosine-specific restriction endonuclease McrA
MVDSTTQLIEAGYEPHPKHWRPTLLADPCAYCGDPSREIDHIVPTAMDDASNGYSACDWNHTNMIGACRRCNRRKKCHSLLAFLSGLPVGRDPEWKIRGIHFDVAPKRRLYASR